MSTAIRRYRRVPEVLLVLAALGYVLAQNIEDEDLAAYRTYNSMRKSRPDEAERFLALHWELRGERDYALLARLRSLTRKDDEGVRREISGLIGSDYPNLLMVLRPQDPPRFAAFSPEGASVVTFHFGTVHMWRTATGAEVGTPTTVTGQVSAVTIAPDGAVVVASHSGLSTVLRRVDNGTQVGATLPTKQDVQSLAFSPDGKSVLTADADGNVQLWQLDRGAAVGPPMHFEDGVAAVAFQEDGKTAAVASSAGTLRTWHPDQGIVSAPMQIQIPNFVLALNFPAPPRAGANAPEGRVLTSAVDSIIRVWAIHGEVPGGTVFRHPATVEMATVSPAGGTVLTLSDQKARLWTSPDSPRVLGESADGAWFSPDGKTVFTHFQNKGRLWRTDSATAIGEPMQAEHDIGLAVFSQGGKMIFTVGENEGLLWRADTGAPIGQRIETDIRAIAFSPDNRTVLTGSSDGSARMWRTDTGAPVGQPFRHGQQVDLMAISPDGKTVLTATSEDKTRLWRATGQLLADIPFFGPILDAEFSPDNKTVLLATLGGSQLFRADSGKPIGARLGPADPAKAAAFSPDGSHVLVRNEDWCYLWEPLGAGLVSAVRLPRVAEGWPRFLDPSGRRVELVTVDQTRRLATVRTVDFDHRDSPPIDGDPPRLLEQWERKLALTFDQRGYIVPRR